jgi:hypothetical protein
MEDVSGAMTPAIDETGGYGGEKGNPPISPEDELLVKKLLKRIDADKKHHKKAFEQMRVDMEYARLGACKSWVTGKNYTANITGRHIRQQVSSLYAKNPKAIARRRPRLDFQVWDENEQTLLMAMQLVQEAQATMQGAMAADPVGTAMQPPMLPPPEVMQAQALIQDFQDGMAERQTVEKIGETLDVLFAYFMGEQKPVDFKTGMKQLVRRVCTTGVGYVELGFQRQIEQDEVVVGKIADVRGQLAHIKALMREAQDSDDSDAQKAREHELALSLQSLQDQEYLVLREGLVFDFPESTHVFPDKRTRNLTGFVGGRWLTIQYLYSPEEVLGLFGVDLGCGFSPYTQDGQKADRQASREDEEVEEHACVFKHYDRQSGMAYYMCDGYKGFLRAPAPPDVYVEDFWPVYALTFNEGEDDEELFPPSDVALLRDMQDEYNRSRQGKREHRRAARPRFATRRGSLDDESKEKLAAADPFDVVEVNAQSDPFDIAREIQAIPVPGVDPNLYDVGEIYSDMQLVVGTSPTGVGASSKGETATGEALAEDSRAQAADSSSDDLDAFLSAVARASGQVLLREMSPESVMKIAGRGAVWPPLTLEDIAGEVSFQMGKIDPMWLAKESLKRLDDRLDLTDALGEQYLPIVAMSRMAGSQMGSDPGAAPDQQGGQGAANGAPAPSTPAGGERGMGANNVV